MAADRMAASPSHWLIGIAESPREPVICGRIRDAGIDLYLPIEHRQQRAGRGRLRDIVLPILRPYFFVPASVSDRDYLFVRYMPGVVGFLEIDGKPAVMKDSELNRIRSKEAWLEEQRRRRILERGEGPHFIVGEPVQISVGFARVQGTVHSVGLSRAEVKLDGAMLFGRSVVEVDLTHLTPAG